MVLALFLVVAGPLSAQDATDWRASFQAGQEALQAEDAAAYLAHMSDAARAMPAGHLNRPFAQYHAARAAAMNGRPDVAVRWLELAWEEGIESLMISFAEYDPAFEPMHRTPAFERVMAFAGDMELAVEHLAGSVHLITGAGSNVVAQIGDEGVVLIDTGYRPALSALRRAVASLDAGPVTQLFVTHPHEDHMGAAEELGAEAIVIAHPATGVAMDEPYVFMEGVEMPPKGPDARPEMEIDADSSFGLNGEEYRVFVAPAHTPGDLIVYMGEARVAHFGDTYLAGNPMLFPGTEDPDAFLAHMDTVLSWMDPATIVVSGHDVPVGLEEVRAQIVETRACMDLVRQALGEGLSAEETAERAGERFAPQWVAFFHRLLSAG